MLINNWKKEYTHPPIWRLKSWELIEKKVRKMLGTIHRLLCLEDYGTIRICSNNSTTLVSRHPLEEHMNFTIFLHKKCLITIRSMQMSNLNVKNYNCKDFLPYWSIYEKILSMIWQLKAKYSNKSTSIY